MNEQNKQSKKMYQRWWVWVLGIIFLLIVWVFGSSAINNAMTKEVPNVMSINYTEAETVLKDNGFNVTSIETDAESILSNDNYNRSEKKGEVFKINNTTNPDYYEKTKDKKITIYYAKNDYTYDEPTATTALELSTSATASEAKTNSSGSSDWRQFLKDYEEWMDGYIEFMAKYKENPTDVGLIADYGKFLEETAEWAEKSEKYQKELEDLSIDDLSEYMQSIARILKKLNDAAS